MSGSAVVWCESTVVWKKCNSGGAVLFAIFASKAKKSMFLKDKPMGTTKE